MCSKKYDPLPPSVLHPYTGGHTITYKGYVFELCPDHPAANLWGYVAQHRLVAERALNRLLASSEQVHHIDCNPSNNDIRNLQVLSRAEHFRLHRQMERAAKYPPMTREMVREALADGGLKAAARALGCSTGTIRNQFPDLVEPYKRKSPAKLDDPKWVEHLRVLAADELIGYREAAKELGISVESIDHILKREGIVWVRKTKRGEAHTTYTFRNRKPSPNQ